MEAVHQGAGQALAGGKAGIGIQSVRHCSRTNGAQWLTLALDVEDGVDPFHRFQGDR